LTRDGWLAVYWWQRLSAWSWQRLSGFGFRRVVWAPVLEAPAVSAKEQAMADRRWRLAAYWRQRLSAWSRQRLSGFGFRRSRFGRLSLRRRPVSGEGVGDG